MSSRQWYEDYQAELRAEQSTKSRQEIKEELQAKTEYVFDPETAPKQGHNPVVRGLKVNCEGAGHPYHVLTWLKKPLTKEAERRLMTR